MPAGIAAVPVRRHGDRDVLLTLAFAGLACVLGCSSTRWPQASIAVAIGLLLLLLMSFDLAFGVVIYVLAAFTFLTEKPNVATALTVLVTFGWIAWTTRPSKRGDRSLLEVRAVAVPVTMFAAWLVVATLWANDSSAAYKTVVRFACVLVLFPIVYAAVRDERHVRWICLAIVVAGGVAGLSGFVVVPDDRGQYGTRLAGIADPNTLAILMLPAIVLGPLLGFKAIPRSRPGARVAALTSAAVCVAATVLTGSRGGLVALAAVLLLAPLALGRWRRIAAAVAAVALIGGYATLVAVVPPEVRTRLTVPTTSGRRDLWTITSRMIQDHPLQGVGTGNFTQESVHYLIRPGRYDNVATTQRVLSHVERGNEARLAVDHEAVVAHNSYLQVWAEDGVIGLGLYLAVITAAVTCGVRAARIFARLREETLELTARGLVLIMGGIAVAMGFASYTDYGRPVWIVLALLVAVYGLARRMEETEAGAR